MKLYAFVFMTNHIHIIISARKEETPLWHIIQDFKNSPLKNNPKNAKRRKQRLDITTHEASGEKMEQIPNTNSGYKMDGAIEISSEKFFSSKSITSIHNLCEHRLFQNLNIMDGVRPVSMKKDDTKFLDTLWKYSDEYFFVPLMRNSVESKTRPNGEEKKTEIGYYNSWKASGEKMEQIPNTNSGYKMMA